MADIAHRVGIRAPIASVYDAVATRDGIAGWWTEDTAGVSEIGEMVTFRFVDDGVEKGRMEMKVAELETGRAVSWEVVAGPSEWVGTTIEFDLHQEDEMTVVRFGHRGWNEVGEFMEHCSMKWATFLLSLRGFVEDGRGRPAPGDLKIDNWN